MADYTQDGRPIAVETPLGKDVLLLRGFSGQEEMSRLFQFELDLLSQKEGIKPGDIVGKAVTFHIELPSGAKRYFHGYVRNFGFIGKGDRLNVYRAEVVPWLWMLTRTSDCRIFQDKTIPEVIKKVFDDLGFSGEYKLQLSGSYRKWDYLVQYRETDFNFVSRLMEQAGLMYYFEYASSKHTLIIADNKNAHKTADDGDVKLQDSFGHILDWQHAYEFTSGKWAHTDYNFEKPTNNLMASAASQVKLPENSKFEFYDFPGEYLEKADGEKDVKVRMEEEEAGHDVVRGKSVCRSFAAGYKFTLSHHRAAAEQKSYILTSVNHHATLGDAYMSGSSAPERVYQNSFTCVPDSVTVRPARITPKPTVPGIQSAVVVGPAGEEIHTDKYGRIKVQFHWDREGKKDDGSSCWMRVATMWSGAKWGSVFVPRIGMEVVVGFLEGDPDQPLVTGCVYNADNMPPYDLPGNKTQSGIKSRSSKKGSSDNFNELRFEDKKGEEEIYIHAEKNFNRVVENDDTLKVGFEKKDKGDQEIKVFNNQKLEVGCAQASDGSQTIQVWKDRTETVKTGNETIDIEKGNRKVTLGMGDETFDIKMGNRKVTLGMGNDELNLKLGNQKTKLDLGQSETEAMQQIVFKVGSSSLTINQMGITLSGIMIKIEGTALLKAEAPLTQVNGSGLLKMSGGIVMIN